MTNFHIKLAYVLGVLLPWLETIRRKSDFGNLWNYIDDYIIGILLIVSATMAIKKLNYGEAFLAGVWGVLCGGLYYSFTSQLYVTEDVSGIQNIYVVLIKGMLFLISIICLVLAIRSANKNA